MVSPLQKTSSERMAMWQVLTRSSGAFWKEGKDENITTYEMKRNINFYSIFESFI